MPFRRLVGPTNYCTMDDNNNDIAEVTSVNMPANPQYNRLFCKYCGKKLEADAVFCSFCGRPQGNVPVQQPAGMMPQQPIYRQSYMSGNYQQPQPTMTNTSANNSTTIYVEGGRSNSMGVAGFVIALIGLIFCWLPVVNFILWFLGLVFSVVGLFKAPRGLAIAGFVLSIIVIILIVMVIGGIASAFASFK